MSRIIIETGKKSGMVFIMVNRENGSAPILAQIYDRDEFEKAIRTMNFITLNRAAFITDWNCAEGRFATDELGWVDGLTISTSLIKWCMFY